MSQSIQESPVLHGHVAVEATIGSSTAQPSVQVTQGESTPLLSTPKPSSDATFVVFQSSDNSRNQVFLGGVAIILFVICWISSLASPLLVYYAFVTSNHILISIILSIATAAYVPWKKSFVSRFFTSFINGYHRCYYMRSSMTFRKKLPDPDEEPTLYAIHPHGIVSLGWSLLFSSESMKHVRFCFATGLYYSPIFLLFCRLVGKPGKANKASMVSYMKRRESLALPPGGFEEATITSNVRDRVYIQKRKGFVKLCLMHGYSIVPVYCFGEKDTFWNAQGLWKIRFTLNGLNIPATIFWGTKLVPILPKRCEMHVVAGEPLKLPKIEHPTRDEVKHFHGKYVEALVKVFEDNKINAYGEVDGKHRTLEIW